MNPLIEQITEQVIAALAKAEAGATPVRTWAASQSAPTSQPGRRLLYVSGSPAQAGALAAWTGWEKHLVTSQGSGWTLAQAESFGLKEIHYMHDRSQLRTLLHQFEVVYMSVSRYNELANLANLCDDCWDVRTMLMAIEEGRRAILDVSSIQALAGIQARIEEYLKTLRGYGFEIQGAPSSTATPTAQSFGSYPGNPDQAFTGAPAEKGGESQCLLKTTGECGGLGQCTRHLKDRVDVIVQAGADRVSTSLGSGGPGEALAAFIDHTLLKADATREQVIELCDEARKNTFASVCINPTWVSLAAQRLAGSGVKVCTVVGFPLGATTTVVKGLETRDAIANGAQEIDMVINVGGLKARDYDLVGRDIRAVVEAAQGALVKVIIETALLSDEEKVKACQLAVEAGADFVKTSTGFGPGGATDHDVALMRQTVGQFMGVKASGSIRDFATAQKMVAAGATRIGASASVAIVRGDAPKKGGGY